MPNDLIHREAGLQQVSCLLRDCQLRLMGTQREFPRKISPTGFFLIEIRGAGPCREAWWLRQEAYLKDMGMAGLVSAWAMVRRRAREYRHKVDAVTRCSGVCPHT